MPASGRMTNFDLLELLRANYISIGNLKDTDLFRSYCYGDPDLWWWHLQNSTIPYITNEPMMSQGTWQSQANNRYKVALSETRLIQVDEHRFDENDSREDWPILYLEDTQNNKVRFYIAYLTAEFPVPLTTLENHQVYNPIQVDIFDNTMSSIMSFDMVLNNTTAIDLTAWGLDLTPIRLYLYFNDMYALIVGREVTTNTPIAVLYISACRPDNNGNMIPYQLDVTTINTMQPNSPIGDYLNNTKQYIYPKAAAAWRVRIKHGSNTYISSGISASIRDTFLSNTLPFSHLLIFRPPTGNTLPMIRTYYCAVPSSCGAINLVFYRVIYHRIYYQVTSSGHKIFVNRSDNPWDYSLISTVNTAPPTAGGQTGYVSMPYGNVVAYRMSSTGPYGSCGYPNEWFLLNCTPSERPVFMIFRYDSTQNAVQTYILDASAFAGPSIINVPYLAYSHAFSWVADQYYVYSTSLDYSLYSNNLNMLATFYFRAITAPQYVNTLSRYIHYYKFVLDDYSNSNIRIPIAIVKAGNINGTIVKKSMGVIQSHRIAINSIPNNINEVNYSDIVLDGYIASDVDDILVVDSLRQPSFSTLADYYEPHTNATHNNYMKHYFRVMLHAKTWKHIVNYLWANGGTYRFRQDYDVIRLVIDIGLYVEEYTLLSDNQNGAPMIFIVYADLFPSVFYCGEKSNELLNINVEWISCRYSIPQLACVYETVEAEVEALS